MARPDREIRMNVRDAGAPMERDAFFRGYTIEELAQIQGVRPVEDFESLLGGWPDEIDDGFEEAVARWRGHFRHNPRNFQHVDGLSLITVPAG